MLSCWAVVGWQLSGQTLENDTLQISCDCGTNILGIDCILLSVAWLKQICSLCWTRARYVKFFLGFKFIISLVLSCALFWKRKMSFLISCPNSFKSFRHLVCFDLLDVAPGWHLLLLWENGRLKIYQDENIFTPCSSCLVFEVWKKKKTHADCGGGGRSRETNADSICVCLWLLCLLLRAHCL